jgi:putative solute:sodium symporter small subunit
MPHEGAHDEQGGAPFAPDLHDARHLWLKAGLLLVWVLVSFVACYFARDLQCPVGQWPLSYWIASQGAVLMFIAIVCVYCAAMSYFERQDRAAEDAADAPPHA